MNILYIKANPNPASFTFKVSDKLSEDLTAAGNTVEVYDLLVNKPKFFDFSPEVTAESQALAQKFLTYDAYVIAAPMWNFGIPAILKAYIDMIAQAGITFKYNAEGKPEGLTLGKKLVFVSASAGDYTGEMKSYDFCSAYIKTVFGFLGITEQQHIAITSTGGTGNGDKAVEKAMTEQYEGVKSFLLN